jgi:hypothetical protein
MGENSKIAWTNHTSSTGDKMSEGTKMTDKQLERAERAERDAATWKACALDADGRGRKLYADLRAELESARAELAEVTRGRDYGHELLKEHHEQIKRMGAELDAANLARQAAEHARAREADSKRIAGLEAERDGAVLRVKNWQTSYEKMGRERDEEAAAHRRTAEQLEAEQLRSHEHAVRAEANAQAARDMARLRELFGAPGAAEAIAVLTLTVNEESELRGLLRLG